MPASPALREHALDAFVYDKPLLAWIIRQRYSHCILGNPLCVVANDDHHPSEIVGKNAYSEKQTAMSGWYAAFNDRGRRDIPTDYQMSSGDNQCHFRTLDGCTRALITDALLARQPTRPS